MKISTFHWRIALLGLLCLSKLGWAGNSSPTFHCDNQRTGRSSNSGPNAASLLWTFPTGGSLQASPVTSSDGTAFLASTDNCLYAVSPDGQLKWTFLAKSGLYSTPAIGPDGTLHFGDLSGWVYALSPDGSVKWTYQLTDGNERRMIAAPVVGADGRSYWASWNNQVYALSAGGTLVWKTSAGGLISSPLSLDLEENLYLASLDKENPSHIAVQKLSRDGRLLWEFEDDLGVDRNRIVASPAIDEERGQIYVAASREESGILYALRLTGGDETFRLVFPGGMVSSPALGRDGTIYLGSLDGKLHAVDPATGNRKWTFSAEGYFVLGSPTVDGVGRIYFGDSDGTLYALTPSGQELWRFHTEASIVSAPVIAGDGTLYCTSCDSRLYVLGNEGNRRNQVGQRLKTMLDFGR